MSMDKKCKKAYVLPAILRQVDLAPRMELLAGSVVDDLKVTSSGQIIDSYNFDESGFNHDWN